MNRLTLILTLYIFSVSVFAQPNKKTAYIISVYGHSQTLGLTAYISDATYGISEPNQTKYHYHNIDYKWLRWDDISNMQTSQRTYNVVPYTIYENPYMPSDNTDTSQFSFPLESIIMPDLFDSTGNIIVVDNYGTSGASFQLNEGSNNWNPRTTTESRNNVLLADYRHRALVDYLKAAQYNVVEGGVITQIAFPNTQLMIDLLYTPSQFETDLGDFVDSIRSIRNNPTVPIFIVSAELTTNSYYDSVDVRVQNVATSKTNVYPVFNTEWSLSYGADGVHLSGNSSLSLSQRLAVVIDSVWNVDYGY